MKHSREAFGEMQLDEYVVSIAAIYSANDRNRSVWDVWCHALLHAAAVAEQLRKRAPATRIFEEIADFSLWLFTVVHKLEGKLGDRKEPNESALESLLRIGSNCSNLLWYRYPNTCPLCYLRKIGGGGDSLRHEELVGPCTCPTDDLAELNDKDAKRAALQKVRRFGEETQSAKPRTINEWQRMFGSVFRENLLRIPLSEIVLHLMEELGEASDAMVRMYSYTEQNFLKGEPRQRQLRLESQIADVLGWLFSLVEALGFHKYELTKCEGWRSDSNAASDGPVLLSEIIWRRYGSDSLGSFYCPFCKNPVCSCPLIFVPATRTLEELKLLLNPHIEP